ncbi:hypothetical protein TELCIR_07296 [Teladorsagia circumcincta]|uniref:Uncharacterized protein n=1 Tax=Teladorsagia circumcincta TaxID=45464 RepID=A0A2G9UMX5_TELCI|nr:hypothetical protein TELCIR_07296 [Teladorsagia circumcincta]
MPPLSLTLLKRRRKIFLPKSACKAKLLTGSARENPLDAIAPINALTSEHALDLVVFSQDWHPHNHISFVESAYDPDRKSKHDGPRKVLKAFESIQFEIPPVKQVLYPRHCVQNSFGAEIHADLTIPPAATFIRKGTRVLVDSYSVFNDNTGIQL